MDCEWKTYHVEDFYDEGFVNDLTECTSHGQVLIMIRDSKYDDECLHYDIAIYDSAFPHLQGKRYSGDRTYFYLPYKCIVATIGRRFSGHQQDVVDFLVYSGVSLPDIMNLDTIQRADGMTSLFGIAISAEMVLPPMHSSEHSGLSSFSGILARSEATETSSLDDRMNFALSKLGWSLQEFKDNMNDWNLQNVLLPVCHDDKFDVFGGRLKFHEALNLDIDPGSGVSKGIMEGFVREALEELGFSELHIVNREVRNGVHFITVKKEAFLLVLKIYKHIEMFLGIVEIEIVKE